MRYLATIIFCAFSIMGCVSVATVPIDVREPAAISFSPEVANLAVVDNSVMIVGDSTAKNLVFADSAQIELGQSLARYLNEEHFFNEVVYIPNFRTESDSLQMPLSKDSISSICRTNDVDAIILIDRNEISGTANIVSYGGFDNYALMAVSTKVLAKTFLSDGEQYGIPAVFADTLYWEGYLPTKGRQVSEFTIPQPDEAMKEAARIAADNLAKVYAPSWKTEYRAYFSDGSDEMKAGGVYARNNDWKNAAFSWGSAYEKESDSSKKARAASNIALANEFMDDIENALVWSDIAMQLLPSIKNKDMVKQIKDQNQTLKNRQQEIKKLEEQ